MRVLLRTFVAALLALTLAPATQAQRESDSLPAHVADRRALLGRYHFEEKDGRELFTVNVSLNADGTALYAVGMGADGGLRAEGV